MLINFLCSQFEVFRTGSISILYRSGNLPAYKVDFCLNADGKTFDFIMAGDCCMFGIIAVVVGQTIDHKIVMSCMIQYLN